MNTTTYLQMCVYTFPCVQHSNTLTDTHWEHCCCNRKPQAPPPYGGICLSQIHLFYTEAPIKGQAVLYGGCKQYSVEQGA